MFFYSTAAQTKCLIDFDLIYVVEFQSLVIMDLWGQAFNAVVVITMFLTLLFILAAFI